MIRSSVNMKQYYHSQAGAIMLDDVKAKEHVENDIDEYETDLQDMLQVCVFVSLFVCMYIAITLTAKPVQLC